MEKDKIIGFVTNKRKAYSFILESNIVNLFNDYVTSFEGFFALCKGISIWRAPNSDIYRCEFCPECGEKIDWNKIYEENKRLLQDYSAKMEIKLYSTWVK